MSYFQRVRIWCKRILRLMGCRLRAELLNKVGSYGFARYSF